MRIIFKQYTVYRVHDDPLTSDKLNNPTNNTDLLIIINNIGVILWIIRINQGSGQGLNVISSS